MKWRNVEEMHLVFFSISFISEMGCLMKRLEWRMNGGVEGVENLMALCSAAVS